MNTRRYQALIDEKIEKAQKECAPIFERLERTEETAFARVLQAMQEHRVSVAHFLSLIHI